MSEHNQPDPASPLWDEVKDSLKHHQKKGKDKTPMDALNRLFRKGRKSASVDDDKLPTLTRKNCSIREERRSTDELRSIPPEIPDIEDLEDPKRDGSAIIAVAYDEFTSRIDGRRRIAKWVRQNSSEDHRIILIEYVDDRRPTD